VHIFVLASLLGVVNAFDIPGRQSFLVDMVGKEDLMNAIALNSSMFNGARVIGPAVAGILVAKLGEGWCFFVNAVSYIAVIIGLLMMDVHAPAKASKHTPALEHIIEGFQFVSRTAPIRALLLLLGLVSITGMPYVVLMPIFADRILRSGGQGLASLLAPRIWGRCAGHPDGRNRGGGDAGRADAGDAVRRKRPGTVDYGVLRRFWLEPDSVCLFEIILVVRGPAAAGGIFHHAADGMLEHADPGDGAGRVARPGHGGVFHDVHGHGADRSPAGRALAGPFSAPTTVAIGGLASLAGAWWFGVQLPKIRVEARQLIIAQGMAGGEPAEEMSARVVED